MRLLAGFDAGQTHTRCRLSVVQNGLHQPVGEGEAPESATWMPPRVNVVSSRRSAPVRSRPSNHPDGVIQAAVVGASGIEHGTALQQRAERLVGKPWPSVMPQG